MYCQPSDVIQSEICTIYKNNYVTFYLMYKYLKFLYLKIITRK